MPKAALPDPPGNVPRSVIVPVVPFGTSGVQRNAWSTSPPRMRPDPTTCPRPLIAVASAPGVTGSLMIIIASVEGSHRNARLPSELTEPTTCPVSLIPKASLGAVPGRLRSVMLRLTGSHRNAGPPSTEGSPTNCPRSLMPKPWADAAPGRLPRSVMEPTAVASADGLGGVFARRAVAPSWSQPQASATARTSAYRERRSIPPPSVIAGLRTCLRQDVRWPVCTTHASACQAALLWPCARPLGPYVTRRVIARSQQEVSRSMPFRLRTFGGLSLTGESGPVTGAATQRRKLALLAVLATGGERGVSRDRLLTLFWSESDAEHARHALTQSLSALRRELGSENLVLGSADLR